MEAFQAAGKTLPSVAKPYIANGPHSNLFRVFMNVHLAYIPTLDEYVLLFSISLSGPLSHVSLINEANISDNATKLNRSHKRLREVTIT